MVAVRAKCMAGTFNLLTWLPFSDMSMEMNADVQICWEKLITEKTIMHPSPLRKSVTVCFCVCLSVHLFRKQWKQTLLVLSTRCCSALKALKLHKFELEDVQYRWGDGGWWIIAGERWKHGSTPKNKCQITQSPECQGGSRTSHTHHELQDTAGSNTWTSYHLLILHPQRAQPHRTSGSALRSHNPAWSHLVYQDGTSPTSPSYQKARGGERHKGGVSL